MAFVPLVNGLSYVWANITVPLFGVPLQGITKISYKRKQDKKNNYGSGVEPVSRGYGIVEYEASMEIYLEEWANIIKAAGNADPLGIEPFDIPVSFGGSKVLARTDILKNAEFLEDPMESASGDTKILVTIPLLIAGVIHR